MFDDLRRLQGQEFDLDSLVVAVNRQLASAGLSSDDERVAAQLDARTVRYYQTLGLVSKPDRYDGRQAVYGYQHLLQLVAIKALQAQGLSLGQVQGWLPAQPVAALQAALAGSLTELSERGAPASPGRPGPATAPAIQAAASACHPHRTAQSRPGCRRSDWRQG